MDLFGPASEGEGVRGCRSVMRAWVTNFPQFLTYDVRDEKFGSSIVIVKFQRVL